MVMEVIEVFGYILFYLGVIVIFCDVYYYFVKRWGNWILELNDLFNDML